MRHVLLHGHIFKNAGTTLDWALRRSFGEAFLDHRDDDAMRAQGPRHLAQLLAQQGQLQALSSHHLSASLPRLDGVSVHPVYLLRHPLRRLRSVYRFERQQQADTPGARAAKQKSFADYVQWRLLPEVTPAVRNYQTRYLAGQHGPVEEPGALLVLFNEALARLQNLPVVGVVEYYDESMVLLELSLQRYFPTLDLACLPQNVTHGNIGHDEAEVAATLAELGELAQLVIDQNSYDFALYQAARARLQGAMAQIDDFPARLADFRRRCAQLREAG